MATETKHYCDKCKKEVWSQSGCATIVVSAIQGIHTEDVNDSSFWRSDEYPYWKHKDRWVYLLCEKCIGSQVVVNYGDTAYFTIADKAWKFLKRFGFIKSQNQET